MEHVIGQAQRDAFQAQVVGWFDLAERDLPWRGAQPWAVMVSEFMLQQTPVSRVLEPFAAWMSRWPTPSDLARESPGEAVRMWGRLGYPRRALRLHASAAACVEHHHGRVPDSIDELRALPGVGEYTAAAISAFAFNRRCAVLDTNVRRVHARVFDGLAYPTTTSITHGERERADQLLPADPPQAARLSVAVMELGALVCTARSPQCQTCPLQNLCAWNLQGQPAWDGPPRRGQTYEGTDRQCRGRLLKALQDAAKPVNRSILEAVWADSIQRERALDSLVADGLIEPIEQDLFALPH